MRWRFKNESEWHRWFAWHPVLVDGRWVWLETVDRRIEDLLFVDRTHYRDKDAARRAATACLAPVPNSTRKPGPLGIAKNATP